jgi:hypothetical protein
LSDRDAHPSAVQGVVAFTDLVGYTEYTALRGDAEALALLTAQERIVNDTLPGDARVVKELGDGLLLRMGCENPQNPHRDPHPTEQTGRPHRGPGWDPNLATGRQVPTGLGKPRILRSFASDRT